MEKISAVEQKAKTLSAEESRIKDPRRYWIKNIKTILRTIEYDKAPRSPFALKSNNLKMAYPGIIKITGDKKIISK